MRILHRRFSTAGLVLTFWLMSACGRAVPDWTTLPIAPANAELSASTAQFVILDGPHLWAIADFELHGEALDILDGSDHTISEYRKLADGSWRFATLIADARQDEAMLRVAAAMSRAGTSLVVVGKDASVWQLGLGGKIIRSLRPDLGCVPQRPRVVALAGNTLLIAGACFDPDNVMREVLWRGTMDGGFVRIATEIRYSADGNRGYLLASTHSLTPTGSGALFGIGVANCLWAVDARATAPHRVCPLVKFAHRVGDPGEAAEHTLSAFRVRYRVGGRAFEWQPLLPVYVDHI
ncbi:MAG TPA: hypothetical protein VMH39_14615, partial [Gemmatimonadaceae bacterium]|nr:hypothetical protein [Gemmatimonadaceae bacterium]